MIFLVVLVYLFLIFPTSALNISPDILDRSNHTVVYELSSDRWLLFPLSHVGYQAKVATHADLPPQTKWAPDQKWVYKIEVQILNHKKEILETRELEYRGQFALYKSNTLGTYHPAYYLQQDALPTLTYDSVLNWQNKSLAAYVRVRLLSKDKDVKTVHARVFEREYIPERDVQSYWNHLNPYDQARMASANIYDLSHLTMEEKKNLIRNLWKPVGPQGIPGKNLKQRVLYTIQEPEGNVEIKPILPAGIYIDAHHQAVIPFSKEEENVRFELKPLTSSQPPYPVYLNFYERKITDPKKVQLTTDDKGNITHTCGKGRLVVWTDKPSILRLFDQKGKEIIQKPFSINSYKIDKTQSIDFEITHRKGFATPFRLNVVRILPTKSKPSKKFNLIYEFYGSDGKKIQSGKAELISEPSLYDSLAQYPTSVISTPNKVYFVIPETVKRVRFFSSEPAYASGYNRPNNVNRSYQIPEDYYIYQSPDESIRRTWFTLTPLHLNTLYKEGRKVDILVQAQPMEADKDVKAGIYEWNQVLPKGNWISYYAFVPKDPDTPEIAQQSPVLYVPLPCSKKESFTIEGLKGLEFVRPTLAYIKKTEESEKVTITVDQKPYFTDSISGNYGSLELPPLAVGKHLIEISCSQDTQCLMNQIKHEKASYFKRQVIHFQKGKAEFSYDKPKTDKNVLTLYLIGVPQKRATVTLSIKGPPSREKIHLNDFTVRNRKYDVIFSKDPIFFLAPTKTKYYTAEPIFIKLGEDLPPGSYTITLESDQSLYALMSELNPGRHNKRTLSMEIEPGPQVAVVSQ